MEQQERRPAPSGDETAADMTVMDSLMETYNYTPPEAVERQERQEPAG